MGTMVDNNSLTTPDVEMPAPDEPALLDDADVCPLPVPPAHEVHDDLTTDTLVERELLISLIAAPTAVTRDVIHALVGDYSARSAGHTAAVLPMSSPLFTVGSHNSVFCTLVTMIDEGQPITPELLAHRLDQTQPGRHHRQLVRTLLLDLVSPAYNHTLPGGVETPHLAALLVDRWFRRGCQVLVTRMQQILATQPTDDLAAHWDTLTSHKQTAERRRLAVTDRLATL